eukprot:403334165
MSLNRNFQSNQPGYGQQQSPFQQQQQQNNMQSNYNNGHQTNHSLNNRVPNFTGNNNGQLNSDMQINLANQQHRQAASASVRRSKDGSSNKNNDEDIEAKLRQFVTQVPQGQTAPQINVNAQFQADRSTLAHKNGRQQSHTAYSAQNSPFNQQINRKQDFYTQPKFGKAQGFLGPQHDHCRGRKTLMLDLDETLVHSQFKQVKKADYTIPVDIEGRLCNIFVLKRPGVEYFLQQLSKYYELVIYTASLSKYAEPLMAKMDTGNWCSYRLFREHCTFVNGVFVKDLSLAGRNLKDTIIIDNSPTSYMFQPECALPSISWYDDMKDKELYELIPLLIELSKVEDVRDAIPKFVKNNQIDYNLAFKLIPQLPQRQSIQDSGLTSTEQSEVKLSHQPSNQNDMADEKAYRQSSNQKDAQLYQSVQQKSASANNHQKLKSVELKQPLINAWTKNQQKIAESVQVKREIQSHKRTNSHQQELHMQNQLVSSSLPAPPVTNITNIIYNFNLTPAQQLLKDQELQIQLQKQQQQQQKSSSSSRRPQTSKQNMVRGESADIRPKQQFQPLDGSQSTKNRDQQSNRQKLNTLEVLKSELQNEELMYNGYSGHSKTPQSLNSKKRPQTGSINSRLTGGYKTQKIEISGNQPQYLIGQGNIERRSNNQHKLNSKGSSQTPKNIPLQGLSQTQNLPSTNQGVLMGTNLNQNQSKYYQKLLQQQQNEQLGYQDQPTTPQRLGGQIQNQRGDSAQNQNRQRHANLASQTQQLKLNYDQLFMRGQISPQTQITTPQSKKQPRSYSSSNNGAQGVQQNQKQNNNNQIMIENQKLNKNTFLNQTPKHRREDNFQSDQQTQNQMMQQEIIMSQQKGGQKALQEKYAAILNKNIEAPNLAKTLRNNQGHLYEKLRASHQNATQFMNRGDDALQTQNLSPKSNMTVGQKLNSNRMIQNLNATDKLKLDYRLTDYNNQLQQQYQGIFMNFASTPQNQNFGSPTAVNINSRYTAPGSSKHQQAAHLQTAQGSQRSSLNARPGNGVNNLSNSLTTSNNLGILGTSTANMNYGQQQQQINNMKNRQGFENTHKFDKNELAQFNQDSQQIMMLHSNAIKRR